MGSRTSKPGCCGSCTALLRRRPDPGAARRPLRRAVRLRAGAGDRGTAARGRPRHGLGRPTRGGAAAAGGEGEGVPGVRAAREWGLIELRTGGVELAARRRRAARRAPWSEVAQRDRAVLAAALGPPGGEVELAGDEAGTALGGGASWLAGADPVELVAGPRAGRRVARPLPRSSGDLVRLEIDGDDLIAAGVPAGPGAGPWPAARRCGASSTGRSPGASEELAAALAAARASESLPPDTLLCYADEMARERGCAGLRRSFPERGRPSPPGLAASATSLCSLNLGALTEDDPLGVREPPAPRRARLRARAGRRRAPGPRRRAAVHTAAQSPSPFAEPGTRSPEVDGHVISEPGLAALVFVADCLPVALAGPGGVAMLHCGWRGLAAGIVASGAEAVGAHPRRDRPRDRALLLRGGQGRCSASSPASARRRRRAHARPARGALGGFCARRASSRSSPPALCTGCEPELLLLPPPRRRADRAPGRARLAGGTERWPG